MDSEKTYKDAVQHIGGAVCHYTRQPLQAIMGITEMARMKAVAGTIKPEDFDSLLESIYRLAGIIQKVEDITSNPDSIKLRDYLKDKIVDLEE